MPVSWARGARYAAAAFAFTSSPLGGAVLGYFLDQYFKTGATYTVILCVVGFFGGTIHLIRELIALQRTETKER